MDANLVYVKTLSGEEAVRKRTRVVQRNMRMVLILVDGSSSVEELCRKAGNVELVESALQELERDGLIELKVTASKLRKPSKPADEASGGNAASATEQPIPVVGAQAAKMPAATSGAMTTEPAMPKMPFSTFDEESVAAKAGANSSKGKGGFAGFIKSKDELVIKPIKKGSKGPYISVSLGIALVVVGIFLAALAGFLFYPYDNYKPRIEEILTRVTGHQVKVASVTSELTPKPAIIVSGISIKDVDFRVKRIRMIPELFSLLGSNPVFSMVEVEGGLLNEESLASFPNMITGAVASNTKSAVRELKLTGLSVDLFGLKIDGLRVNVRPDDKSGQGMVVVSSADRTSFKATLQSVSGVPTADIEAIAWAPVSDFYRFDSLQGKLSWDNKQATLTGLDARIFDGSVMGSLSFARPGGQALMTGDLMVKRINVQRLAETLGYSHQFEGELEGNLRIQGQSADWGSVFSTLAGDGSISVSRGILGGFNVAEAVRLGRVAVRGGSTRFDQLNGKLRLAPGVIQLNDLSLNSGILRAVGTLNVTQGHALGGRLNIEMRSSANVVRTPLAVSGLLKDPMLQGGL